MKRFMITVESQSRELKMTKMTFLTILTKGFCWKSEKCVLGLIKIKRKEEELKFPESFHVQVGLRESPYKVNLAPAELGEAGFVENIKVTEDKAVFSIINKS